MTVVLRRSFAVVGLLAVAIIAAGPVQASHHGCFLSCGHSCALAPCYEVTFVEKTVTCYKPDWRERDVTCTINRVTHRIEVDKRTCTVMVPEWKEEKRVRTVMTRVPREVEKEVTYCKWVQATATDSCGNCYVTRKPETHTRTIKCTVWDCKPEQKEFTIRVCHYKPVERTFDIKRVVCDVKPETVTRKERYCVMVPYEAKVKVAVCTPVVCK